MHGCLDELHALLTQLGYEVGGDASNGGLTARHPAGRKAVFLGDLVDRGPNVTSVLRLAMSMVASGSAIAVPGNHDIKLLRKLRGKEVKLTHGLAESVAQLEGEPEEFRREVATFIDDLVSHYVLDGGHLGAAHAGMKEPMQGRGSGKVREFALYGETTGETDEYGLPVRYDWAAEYRGKATVVYGHTPVPEAEWLNNTICVDTGCVFGRKLTALRWPERELVSVPAARVYFEPAKPLAMATPPALSAQHEHDTLLDLGDVTGKRIVSTHLFHNVTIREENSAAALEAMSRFAADPRWLVYLPPTMSPSETSREPGLLEHPREALEYFAKEGIERAVCEEKHMGSRAICRDDAVARRRFGVDTGEAGICYTRTGRRFFNDAALEQTGLPRPRPVGAGRVQLLGRARDRLGLHRRRANAVVAEGAGAPARPVRGGGRSLARRASGSDHLARERGWSEPRCGAPPGTRPRAARAGLPVRRSLPPVLLGGVVGGRLAPGAVPPACARGQGPRRARPCLAHGGPGEDLQGGPRPPRRDARTR